MCVCVLVVVHGHAKFNSNSYYYLVVVVVAHAECIFRIACKHTFRLKHLKISSGQQRNAHMHRNAAAEYVVHKFANKLNCKQL